MRDGGYCLKTTGGPLTRLPLRSTVTSTRSAILMKGIPLFIPYCLRSKAIVPYSNPFSPRKGIVFVVSGVPVMDNWAD